MTKPREFWILSTHGGTVDEDNLFFSKESAQRYLEENKYNIKDWHPVTVCEVVPIDNQFDHPCKDTCSGWKQGYEKGQLTSKDIPWDKVWANTNFTIRVIDKEKIQELVERALTGTL